MMDLKKNYEYFQALWEDHKPGHGGHTSNMWDDRAGDWAELLSSDTPFKRSLDERVAKVSDYFRSRGLLTPGSNVVDIGCGPGRFVAEFARTSGHAMGIDISAKMLEYGEAYARSIGLENTSYHVCDFKEADIEKLGWTERFDLVFTSITPAIGDMESLQKAMKMSRGYCFNSCFIRYRDDLEARIAKSVFSKNPKNEPLWSGRWFYSLLNILWLEGYFPETFYHKQNSLDEVVPDDELVRYFTRLFSKNRDPHDVEVRAKISDYLHSIAGKDGTIKQYTERWYGWILWDVRDKDCRIGKDARVDE